MNRSRRYPKLISFDSSNEMHQKFIIRTLRVLENLFYASSSSSSSLTSPTSAAAQFLGTVKERKSFTDEEILAVLHSNSQKLIELSKKQLRKPWKRSMINRVKELANLTIVEFDKVRFNKLIDL